MTAEAQWDSTRWRDASQPPRYNDLQQHPQAGATHSQSASLERLAQPWYATSQSGSQHYDHDSRRASQSYGAQPSHYNPTDPFAAGNNHGRASHPPYHSHPGGHHESWQSMPSQNDVTNDRRSADAPLSVQIPNKNTELPSIAHGYTTPRSDAPMYSSGASSWSHHTTSLPSFAALSEQTTRNEEPDEVEIAPMSARLSCSQCAKLAPLVREAATVLAELDGSIQSLCSGPITRLSEIPRDSTMRTVQWILDRMRYSKRDLQDAVQNGTVDQNRSHMASSMRHSNPLKRTADQWESDEMPTLKFPRATHSFNDGSYGDRRASIDFATREPVQRSAYSPAPSDSAPGSAYPRTGSPSARLPRALPSPSSLACPPSGAASFVPANTASVGSPGTSHHPASSIHTVSTNSATSAHLQDLQHQVSLKSLALQTLQTEYATLLQKLQRERIKSQTIEKKTTVADQEVNDLTTRNEELLEQIKSLESQLQECERKREAERAEAAQEKDQWGRMLDMSGRLQHKNAEDRQRLASEKAELLQRLAAYEDNPPAQLDQSAAGPRRTASRSPFAVNTNTDGDAQLRMSASSLNDHDALRRENDALRAEIASMRTSLEEVRHRYNGMEDSMQHFMSQKDCLRRAVDQALGGEKPTNADAKSDAARQGCTPTPHDGSPTSHSATTQPDGQSLNAPRSFLNARTRSPAGASSKQGQANLSADPLRPENLAHIARAVSPGPAELGFHVQPSTSSPEELIKALGPVPAPLPSIRFPGSSLDDSTAGSSGPRQHRRQSQPFVAPLSLPPSAEFSAFRPLNHPQPPSMQNHSAQYPGSSPHSYYSSPGPNVSNTSSPGTASTQSPEYSASRRDEFAAGRRHSQPHLYSAASPSTAAMPPPPRPLP